MRINLIDERKKKALTQAEIAKLIGITTRQYINLEAGTSAGSIKVWERLKKQLQAKSIDYLLKQVNSNTPKE